MGRTLARFLTACPALRLLTATSLLLAANSYARPQSSSADCLPVISIVSSSLTINGDSTKGFLVDVLIRNDGSMAVSGETATFYLFGYDGGRLDSAPPKVISLTVNIPAGAVQDLRSPIDVKAPELPISGFAVIGATATGCANRAKEQTQTFQIPSQASAANSCLIIFATASLVLVMLLAAVVRFRSNLMQGMGSSEWSFSGSAATNITIVGSLLTAVLASTAIPDFPVYLSKQGYIVLGLFFGILVGLAPIVYNFCCQPKAPDPSTPEILDFRGSVLLFLISAAITLWGVFGQLTTISVMFLELAKRKTISQLSAESEWAIASSLAFSILFYCYRCLKVYVDLAAPRKEVETPKTTVQVTPETPAPVAVQPPRWTAF